MPILITGAAGGIGAACVRAASAADPAEIVIACARDIARVPSAPNVVPVSGDLAEPIAFDDIADVLAGEPLRAAIANHAVTGAGALRTLTDDFIDHVLRLNYASVVQLWHTVAPNLAQMPSAFVAIASQAGLVGEASNVVYCASKFALLGWVHAIRRDAPDAIRVRALCPGATDTPMLRQAIQRALDTSPPEHAANVHRMDQIAVGRYGQPEEIAAAALYLTNRHSPTPEILAVTGGDILL